MKVAFKHKVLYVIGLLVVVLLVGCTKNDDTTLILLGTESYVKDIEDVVSPELLNELEALPQVGALPQGCKPPKIEGSFKISPRRVKSNDQYWNQAHAVVEPDVLVYFRNQHNSVVELEFYEATATLTDTVFVVGKDNCFTVYFQENKTLTINDSIKSMTRAVVMTGEMCDEGIKNFLLAEIVRAAPEGFFQNEGDFFIYEDSDGLAERIY